MSGDISADILSLRRNGTGVFTFSGDQGTGNYSNVPIYVGMRAGSSLPFNGYIYSLIVRGAQSTAYQISSTELWVASRTGFLPPVITGVPTVGVS